MNYAGDAWSSMKLAHIFGLDQNRVQKYEPSFCKDPKVSSVQNTESTAAGIALTTLATEFVGLLKVNPVVRMDMKSLVKAAIDQEIQKPSSDLLLELDASLNAQQKELLNQAMQLLASEERARRQAAEETRIGISENAENIQTAKRPSEEMPTATLPPAKKANIEGLNNLPGRATVSGLATLEDKVAKIVELSGLCPPCTSALTPAAKTFVMRTVNPVKNCLDRHFKGDVSLFSEHWWQNFKIKFSAACCKGEGENCPKAPAV